MLTVLTATYNRGYCITNLYQSLLRQTDYNFEWIIIDDGSTDNTKEIIENWKEQDAPFEVRFYKQKNGGKHRALNYAISMAKGEYCFIVDSDDSLIPEAIEKIQFWVKKIEQENCFAGIGAGKGFSRNDPVGEFPNKMEEIDAKYSERSRKKLRGDKAEVYRTELLKNYPFPEFAGENFLPEQAVWDQIAQEGYTIRWHREIIYLCQYQEDGLTQNLENIVKNNIEGFSYVYHNVFRIYPFPYNWTGLAWYIEMVKKIGMSKKEIKIRVEINSFQYIMVSLIFVLWKIRRDFIKYHNKR